MKVIKWVTIGSGGATRLTTSKPKTSPFEISMLLEINIPDEIFLRPHLEAKIDIPQDAVGPQTITTEVVENMQDAIQSATGLTLSINVVKEEVAP